MSAATGLYRLQQVDSQIDGIQTRKNWIQDTLQNDVKLRSATQTFETADNKYKDAARALKQTEAEVEKQRIKIEQTEASLYGGRVQNPKELQDLQKDIASLKKHLQTLEERELEAMVLAETTENELQTAKLELEQTQADVKEQNRDLANENDAPNKDLERLEHERNAILSDLVSSAVNTYEQIRKYCERNEVSMSEFVEERIADFFGNGGSRPAKSGERIKPDELQDAARYFTF